MVKDSHQTIHKKSNERFSGTNSEVPVEEREDHFDICQNACSATDCTGLIPNLADDAEIDAYQDLYDFLPKAARAKKETE